VHVDRPLFLFASVGATVGAAPHVLAGFAYAAGGIVVPYPGEVERGELCGDGVFGGVWGDCGGELDGVGGGEGEVFVCDRLETGDTLSSSASHALLS
jgi:hypothetical protein